MSEKINMFNIELDSIELVLGKLVTRQNSSVFDKLCIKCNGLLDKIIDSTPEIITSEERGQVISILRRLRDAAVRLSEYKQYLIATIDNNIKTLEEEGKIVEFPSDNVLSLEEGKARKLTLINENKMLHSIFFHNIFIIKLYILFVGCDRIYNRWIKIWVQKHLKL